MSCPSMWLLIRCQVKWKTEDGKRLVALVLLLHLVRHPIVVQHFGHRLVHSAERKTTQSLYCCMPDRWGPQKSNPRLSDS